MSIRLGIWPENNITPEQKKRRFRELAQHDRIRTGRQLAEELEQPFLPLIDECPDVQRKEKRPRPAWSVNERSP